MARAGYQVLVIPEYAFAVMPEDGAVRLTREHSEFEWLDYEGAMKRLKYDSNRTALWELDSKIRLGILKQIV
ncbi:MAG TPA: hypothetical protein PKZ39_01715 [Clostridia bacterium]|nr:hypothetical protein [Clostridia bacterium]